VQTLDLTVLRAKESTAFHFWPNYAPEWLEHFCALKGGPTQNKMHEAILQRIIPKQCFAVLTVASQVVACGLAVLEGGYVGLFDLITAENQRRQGYGQALVFNLLQWAKSNGATKAYLQVETNNAPALKLYAKVGFSELYQYWYRVQPQVSV
jgi:ribosomal protein S18 acetylase RimI-like enzyme